MPTYTALDTANTQFKAEETKRQMADTGPSCSTHL